MGFWWGLFLLGWAAQPARWWNVAGPLAITALFVFISIPMKDKRMLANHPEWAAHMKRTSALLPMPRRR
jgi:steroid 5-alpha reductase family enzyme